MEKKEIRELVKSSRRNTRLQQVIPFPDLSFPELSEEELSEEFLDVGSLLGILKKELRGGGK